MSDTDLVKQWETDINRFLKGKTIKEVKYLSKTEAENSMWYKRPVVIIFTDGSYIIPMADDEGNDGGAMYTSDKDLPTIPVI